jgi:hypothetical protein
MKKYIPFSMILLLLSCNVEEVSDNEITTASSIITQDKEPPSTSESQQRTVEDDIEVFRLQMEWASFITAEILAEVSHPIIIGEMDNAIATYGTVIPMQALLGDSSNYPNLKIAFKEKFLEYYIGDCRPNFGTQRPPNSALVSDNPPPPAAPNTAPNYIAWAEAFTVSYINQITNVNCVELYIPYGIEYVTSPDVPFPIGNGGNGDFDIPSYIVGAHPLTNQTSGGSGWRIYPGKPRIAFCTSYMAAGVATLSTLEISSGNVIIARPYRDQDADCNYTSIAVSDFTLYLE